MPISENIMDIFEPCDCDYCRKWLATPRRLRLVYSCSDYVEHRHRFRAIAWLCGRWQLFQRVMAL